MKATLRIASRLASGDDPLYEVHDVVGFDHHDPRP
jgi:hypothetical protein